MKVVAQWKQPADVSYNSFDPYYLSIVESDFDWRGFPFHVERNYFVYVGRESGKPSYGHMIKYSFHPGAGDIKTFLSKAKVQWAPDGVTLDLESGHRLFIPKKMFVGGR